MPAFSPEAVEALKGIHQGTNGKDTYSNDKAMYGYIAADKYMYVTAELLEKMEEHWKTDEAPRYAASDMGKRMAYANFKKENSDAKEYQRKKPYLIYGNTADERLDLQRIQACNYMTLKASGLDPTDAFVCAALRTRWLSLGCLYTDSKTTWAGNNSPFDETMVMAAPTSKKPSELETSIGKLAAATDLAEIANAFKSDDDAQAYVNAMQDKAVGLSWVVNSAEAIWAIVEYFFRTRGHHWKKAYMELAKKMFNSGFEGNLELPSALDVDALFHTSIHPFGVAQLPKMVYHFALCAKLGNSFLLRLEAAPNGLAVITTSAAALDSLRTEAWWNAFYKNMKDQVDLVTAMSKVILADKYSYHMSANLYNATKKNTISVGSRDLTLEEAKSAASPVATVVEGFINYLNEEVKQNTIKSFSLSNAKSLTKHASGNPSLAIKVTILCDIVSRVLNDTTDMAVASKAVFPELTAVVVQKEAIEVN